LDVNLLTAIHFGFGTILLLSMNSFSSLVHIKRQLVKN